jgi:hypothetical protein
MVARGYDQVLKSIARAGMMPEGGFNDPLLGATALRVAASRGHVHVIRYLLSQHSKLDVNAVDAKFTTAIYCAAKNGKLLLLPCRCVSMCVVCVVCRAIAVSDCFGGSGHVAAIRELASEGADVDTGIQPGHSGGCGSAHLPFICYIM